jgi:hypothetical protein
MSALNDAIVHSLTTAQKLLNRYCEDLKPEEYLHRPCSGGNATAWLIGHIVMTERSALARAGVTDLPPLPEGFEKRFSRDEAAPKASDFGDVTILLPLFNRHRDLLIEAVREMSPAALEKPLDKPHPLYGSRTWEAINFAAGAHVAMHAGQITIIRRSLGKPPIV